ncbi:MULTISPECIES: hypothetical protein [Lactobacillus]|jgi:hypothetical protein|uniref:Transposase n=1 Tax=Lactobacillus johnsonii TaxID=33959 RepID=A0AAW5M2B4_LACJH|nr:MULTISPECIES: hypothetical protein [Lactobacillus]MCR1914490.1 hypothetical protein [Lactobacillus johnsonii]
MTQLETFTAISPTEVQKLFNEWVEDLSPRIIEIKITSKSNKYTLWVTYQL